MPSIVFDLAKLASDATFQRFSTLQGQPNIFRAIGRTHTETWHSAFLAWLLDPEGSHQLQTFPLKRFLATVADLDVVPEEPTSPEFLTPSEVALIAATHPLEDVDVLPNERAQFEKQLPSGRLDVWAEVPAADDADGNRRHPGFKLIVEVKINADLGDQQCVKYANNLQTLAKDAGQRALVVFLARTEAIADTATETTGDPRWYCLDFQRLHDDVIIPCFEHPDVSPRMKGLIEHYLLNLREPNKGRRGRMAYTKEERELALSIYHHHKPTFDALAEILKDELGFPQALAVQATVAAAEPQTALRLKVDGASLEGANVTDLFLKAIQLIWSKGKELPQVPLPCGRKRYLIAPSPQHQDGSDFIRPYKLPPRNGQDLYLEVNFSRAAGVKIAKNLLISVGFNVTEAAP